MLTNICYDLHCHSTASDGVLSPCEVVERAAEKGVTTLALTDHDTVAGLSEAKQLATSLEMRFICGIELSAAWEKQSLHIVGLNINPLDEALSNLIMHLQTIRQQRAEKIAEKLAKKGIDGVFEAVQLAAGNGMITRTHFADFLVSRFYANTQQDAFDRYLGEGKVAYVSTIWTPLDVCVKTIKAAGGFAVIAHPLRYKLTATRMKKLLMAFKQLGGDAIEVVTGRYNSDEIRVLATYAKQFELAGSVGSDFHDPSNQWLELGRLAPLPTTVKPIWELWN